jgi:hypothetical protein
MKKTFFASSILAVLVTTGLVTSAAAQQAAPTQRPFRPLFRGEPPRPQSDLFEVTLSALQGYDQNVLAERLPSGQLFGQEAGMFTDFIGDVTFAKRSDRVNFDFVAASNVRYLPDVESSFDGQQTAAANLNLQLSRRTRLTLGQVFAYSTFYTLSGFGTVSTPRPDDPSPPIGPELLSPQPQFAVSHQGTVSYASLVTIARELGRRASIDAGVSRSATRVAATAATAEFETTSLETEFGYRYAFTSTTGINLRYGRRAIDGVDSVDGTTIHNIDIGAEYRRPLTRSGNTLLSFSSGSTLLQTPTEKNYTLQGTARLTRLFGRSWSTSLIFTRSTEFLEVISQLFSNNALSTSLDGYINERLHLTASGSYADGFLGTRAGIGLTTWSATGVAQYGLTRKLALEAQYLLYRYEFAPGTEGIPAGLPRERGRQAVRAGLVLWLPFIR